MSIVRPLGGPLRATPPRRRLLRRIVIALLGVAVAIGGVHVTVDRTTRFVAPSVSPDVRTPVSFDRRPTLEDGGGRGAKLGESFLLHEKGMIVARLAGSASEMGAAHSRLLHDELVRTESELWRGYAEIVRAPLRPVFLDLARVRYRDVDRFVPEARRIELSAQAAAFSPDPFAGRMPAYTRMMLFHALYDIALAFEEAPFLGCTSFVLKGRATTDGHTLVGRVFDFEATDVYDSEKVVFLVRGAGTIPYLSVAWGGLTGVLSGMNAEGVVAFVQGARAGEAGRSGIPIVFSLRGVLERAHDTDEAVRILTEEDVLAPHLVLVADARGAIAIVERAAGLKPHFVRSPPEDRVALSNHFEGPLASDPRNLRVRASTTSNERRARMDALLAKIPDRAGTPKGGIAVLRDHGCEGDPSCPLGDRRAIDALIATHGFLADTTARVLYVSKGPHLAGAFLRFDLRRVLDAAYDPERQEAIDEVVDADPILSDGSYSAGRRRAGGPLFGPGPAR